MGGFIKKTIRDVPLDKKTVLVRVDYNVPLNDDGNIADDFRIRASIPTIRNLLERDCRIVLIAHMGRPEGHDPRLSFKQVAAHLSELLSHKVGFIDEAVGEKVRAALKKVPLSSVTMLENLRYYSGEKADDPAFAKRLAKDSGAQYFVQDAFGNAHREDASTSAITIELPSVAGLLLEKEYVAITSAMKHPKRPFTAVLGGAKVSDKLPLLEALIPKADMILVGGAMANTFLAYKGISLGKSKIESGQEEQIKKIYEKAARKVGAEKVDSFIVLPKDLAVGKDLTDHTRRRVVSYKDVKDDDFVLDIGDKTIEAYCRVISHSKTVIWNGTLGLAEREQFAHGSARVALTLATHSEEVTSVIGGGDTADFALHWDSKNGESFSHVSTGGGASLQLMSGKKLPAVECLL